MDMLGALTILLAGIGAVLIALGFSQISTSPHAWKMIAKGALCLAISVVLTAINVSMSNRKNDQSMRQPPPASPPSNYRNSNTGGVVNYDQTCGYRPDQPQYPGPDYSASRQFYIVGTISSGPGGANLALESGASTVAVAK